jgi:hypothetical protein
MLGVGAIVLGPTAPAMATPSCSGILSVFARGSQDNVDFNPGESTAFYNQLNSRVSGLGFNQVDLGNLDGNFILQPGEYPAVGPSDWGITSSMSGYYASVWTGVSELTNFLNARASSCPHESIVVGGYSQGAEVVGYALEAVSNYTLSHVGYVALYGDPRDNSCSNSVWRRGSASCALGILGARGNPYYVPPAVVGRTGSWCDSHDGVCTGNSIYLPILNNPLSTHPTAYQDRWIADSGWEVASRAVSKWNELNAEQPQATVPSYTITPPDTSPDSPAAPPPPPTINQVKRTLAPDGTSHEVYAATNSTVTEGWWQPGGDGVHTDEIINIAQDNIVGFDKVNQPDGVTQSLYTAVPDGVWETYWRPGVSPQSAKIVTGLTGVRQIIVANAYEGSQFVHRLYLLAQDGPYEVWWKDGGDGVHVDRLNNITGGVAMTAGIGPDGAYEVFVATPTWVYQLWWFPGGTVNYRSVINITQGDIRSLSMGANLNGGQLLYTGTSTSAWQSWWLGDNGAISNGTIATGQTNAIQVEKDVYNGVHELYLATGDHVQEYWWNDTSSGGGELIRITQNNITSFDKSDDGAYQQIYTASGNLVYETYWAAGVGPTSNVLFSVTR